jgi:hypothetical protein
MTATSVALPVRRPSPRSLGILARQLRAELRLNVRAPEFVVPVLALPILLYVVFGAPRAADPMPAGTVGAFMMVGFSIYGVLNVVLFAVGEALYVGAYASRLEEKVEQIKGSLWMSKQDWKRSWPAWLRATAIGFPFGKKSIRPGTRSTGEPSLNIQ